MKLLTDKNIKKLKIYYDTYHHCLVYLLKEYKNSYFYSSIYQTLEIKFKKRKNILFFLSKKKNNLKIKIIKNKLNFLKSEFSDGHFIPEGKFTRKEDLIKIKINFSALKNKYEIIYFPRNKEQLIKLIKNEIFYNQGTKKKPNWHADLNCINTNLITDMSHLFSNKYGLNQFNGDISKWDVSNVRNMEGMFDKSQFNQDISRWDVSNVEDMSYMFINSQFNGDISNWDVSNVKYMQWMFAGSKFNQDISKWNVKNKKRIDWIFFSSDFNQDIGFWPKDLKKQTELENISVSSEYNRLPDKIIYPETIANIFIRSIKYPGQSLNINNFKRKFFKEFLENRKELYKNKGYKSEIINKLILNDIADILKHLTEEKLKKKFLDLIKIN